MKDRLFFLLKVVVSVGLLVFLVRRIGGGAHLLSLLRQTRPVYVVLAFGFYVTAVSLSSGKWAVLLRAQGIRVPLRVLIRYTFMGTFFNNFLPANVGGDVMRGYGLARHTDYTTDAAVSVIMDRLVGLLAFLTAAVVAGTLIVVGRRGPAGLDEQALANVRTLTLLAWGGEAGLGMGIALLLSRRAKRWTGAWLQRIPLLAGVVPLLRRVAHAVNAYRHAYASILLGMTISWTVLLLTAVENWLLVQALAPGRVPFIYLVLFNPLIAFALLIPLSVGGLGIGQSAYVFFFGLIGVSSALALAISLLHQAIVYAASLPGAYFWVGMREARGRVTIDDERVR